LGGVQNSRPEGKPLTCAVAALAHMTGYKKSSPETMAIAGLWLLPSGLLRARNTGALFFGTML